MSEPALPNWMAGHWLQCTPGREVSETWTDARGDVLLGMSKTLGRRTSWEFSRIGRGSEGISFFAYPSNQRPAEFRAIENADLRIVFENTGHDFPNRITYRREADHLIARIEGTVDGKPRSSEWTYTLSPLKALCPL
ncbi:DUF6265 family protein [Asticcacaulis sp. MM231]|uniref:DUF6265 family protein n=1 Tax=Asticcacaulis sp. MM231 TaxID=3157666 RepID=UPI0032D58346